MLGCFCECDAFWKIKIGIRSESDSGESVGCSPVGARVDVVVGEGPTQMIAIFSSRRCRAIGSRSRKEANGMSGVDRGAGTGPGGCVGADGGV
jgi:hypothetical protein